jgi:hypothetical protein
VASGDTVTLSGTASGTFADANVGTDKAVTVTGLSLVGADAYKYTLDLSGFTGTINKAEQTAPGAPTLYASIPVTATQISVANINNCEFAISETSSTEGLTWVLIGSNYGKTYFDLTPNTTYYVFARLKENTNYNASPASAALTVTTNKATLTGTLSITGTAKYGETLEMNTSALTTDVASYTDFGTLSYKWMRGHTGSGFTIIEGAASSSYVLTTADIGLEIKAQVYPDNCLGFATSDPTGTVTKADAPTGVNQTYEVVKNHSQSYSFDLTTLLPSLPGGLSFGDITYAPALTNNSTGVLGALFYDSSSGNTLPLPVNAANTGETATITVTVSSANFGDFTATITVSVVDKLPVTITGVTISGGTYNGSSFAYTGTPIIKKNTDQGVVNGITLDALYESTDGAGYNSNAAPKNAGAYMLTLSVPADNETYTGSTVVGFSIAPKTLTIKADDKSAKVGESESVYTYMVTGLVSGDSLTTNPVSLAPRPT